jgi:SAM-dependent methyltransferase
MKTDSYNVSNTAFNENQLASAYPEGVDRHYWTLARNAIIADTLRKSGLQGMRMLEIGCGQGVVLRSLRSAGFDCYGVDVASTQPPNDLIEYLHYGVNFESLEKTFLESVEVVLLFDVIEHIEDDVSFIQKIRTTFPSLKYVVVTVPARIELWSNFDTHYGHFRRYSSKTLSDTIERGGMSMHHIQYFFHALYIPAWILARCRAERSTDIYSPRGVTAIFHKLIAGYCYLEYLLFPATLPGTSIVAVLENRKQT